MRVTSFIVTLIAVFMKGTITSYIQIFTSEAQLLAFFRFLELMGRLPTLFRFFTKAARLLVLFRF